MGRVDKSRGLSHVNSLIIGEFSIKEGSFYINLMYLHVASSSNGENSMNGCKFGNRCKGVKVINARYL